MCRWAIGGSDGGGGTVLSTNDAYVAQGLRIVSQMLRLAPQPVQRFVILAEAWAIVDSIGLIQSKCYILNCNKAAS